MLCKRICGSSRGAPPSAPTGGVNGVLGRSLGKLPAQATCAIHTRTHTEIYLTTTGVVGARTGLRAVIRVEPILAEGDRVYLERAGPRSRSRASGAPVSTPTPTPTPTPPLHFTHRSQRDVRIICLQSATRPEFCVGAFGQLGPTFWAILARRGVGACSGVYGVCNVRCCVTNSYSDCPY